MAAVSEPSVVGWGAVRCGVVCLLYAGHGTHALNVKRIRLFLTSAPCYPHVRFVCAGPGLDELYAAVVSLLLDPLSRTSLDVIVQASPPTRLCCVPVPALSIASPTARRRMLVSTFRL